MDLSSDQLPLLRARRELSLERRRLELRRENQLFFFTPHPKQNLFFQNAGARYRYARTGNRFGKSEMGAAEDVAFALGYRPWLAEGDPLRTLGIPTHPTKGLIVCTTWKKSREVFTEIESGNLGKLFKYIPHSCLGTPTRNHSGFIDRIPVRHVSGEWSVIMIDTIEGFKKNSLAQESSVHDWCHIDEPIPEAMWKAIARGLVDRGGRAWFTCTPLTEPWIDEAFVPDLGSDREESISFSYSDRFMMTGTMHDNPHNTKEDIASFLGWLTEDEKECRINGLPTAFAGLVYKEFSWDTHVLRDAPPGWTSWSHPPADHTLRFAIDYHPRKPHAVLFIATSPLDYHYVYEEIWSSCLMSELVTDIKRILHGGEPTVPGLIDPLASTPNRVTDITPLEEVLRLGLPVMPATKDPHNGILRVKEVLSARDRVGRPTIVFNGNLPRTLKEISRGFVWDGETNKPIKNNDDMMENFYRLCLQGLSYIEPAKATDYAPIAPRDLMHPNIYDDNFGGFDDPDYAAAERKSSRAALYRARYRN